MLCNRCHLLNTLKTENRVLLNATVVAIGSPYPITTFLNISYKELWRKRDHVINLFYKKKSRSSEIGVFRGNATCMWLVMMWIRRLGSVHSFWEQAVSIYSSLVLTVYLSGCRHWMGFPNSQTLHETCCVASPLYLWLIESCSSVITHFPLCSVIIHNVQYKHLTLLYYQRKN